MLAVSDNHSLRYSTLENESLVCARCGYCRNVCPIYQTVGWESATPRGKISLARQMFTQDNTENLNDEFVHRLAQCTLCGACGQACSTDIDTRHLWVELRERMAKLDKAPEGYKQIHTNLVDNKNITTFDNDERLDWADDLDDPESLQPRIDADVCYFVGCVSSFYPQASEIAISVAEIFNDQKINFTTLGGDEWCCGFPLFGAGYVDDAHRFIKHNVERIKALGIHTLVASCPSCCHVWRTEGMQYLDGYKLKIFHTTEYMAKLISTGRIKLKQMDAVITYHDPCDLGRNGNVYDPPREIIKAIPEAGFVELEHHKNHSLCCGGGGNLQSADPDLMNEISDLRVKEIEASEADILVSACQQCTKVLGMAIRRAKLKIKVMDLNQLIERVMISRDS